jgi:oligopeptide/dipeptide ABC transporter ATP-binding protein
MCDLAQRGAPLVALQRVAKHYPGAGGRTVFALDGVSLEIRRGETLGLVGESGCGKSTLARCVVRLLEPSDGRLVFDGQDITHLAMASLRPLRRRMQMIFQDSMTSLNPLKPAGRIVADALSIQRIGTAGEQRRRVAGLFAKVGLLPEQMHLLPRELSGGQRQRIGIARALALRPQLIVADEPVSALDVSVQADILNLLADLRAEYGITYLFISHDLGVIRQISHRVGVMYLGRLVEIAPAETFFRHPRHRYSQALLSAMPDPVSGSRGARRGVAVEDDVPSPIAPPAGCRFHPRCRYADETCRRQEPELARYGPEHFVACHHPDER